MHKQLPLNFAGHALQMDARGALYWPEEAMLIVSDLHLEKGSFLAAFGAPLPRYDTRRTLEALAQLIEEYRPEQLVCLGDSFHDVRGYGRLETSDRGQLLALIAKVPRWHWILGNHDPVMPCELPGERHIALMHKGLSLRHEPEREAGAQLIGHFHPCVRVSVSGQKVKGPAFVYDAHTLIMPAFGSFTGGLDVCHAAIASLVHAPSHVLMYREKLWRV